MNQKNQNNIIMVDGKMKNPKYKLLKEMNKKKVFVLGATQYANWLPMELTSKIEEADLILFTGGEDVSPFLYGDKTHPTTNYSEVRDLVDVKNYHIARGRNTPMLGICRGSQFLTAMQEGGRLIQDVSNHAMAGTHEIKTKDGKKLDITSTHHQMHYPFDMKRGDYEILASSLANRSTRYLDGKGEIDLPDDFVESEIIYFHKSNALGIQGHPEHLAYNHPTCDYLRELVHKTLF